MIVRAGKNQIEMEELFAIPFIKMVVQEDTSELISNTDFIPGMRQWYQPEKINYRVLEKYPNTKNILLKYIRSSVKMMGYSSEVDVSTSWCTKVVKGDVGHLHRHKNSWFSALYYYGDYDENCGKFILTNPLNDLTSFMSHVSSVNEFNRHSTTWLPRKNQLIIFPSYIQHGISEHLSDLIRYSLAINIVPVGTYGRADSTYDTSWY
tara:strand:- start:23 stop:643 length:621 start_codon:yes stop_codon:yes gene_type:complete